jgi:hypothetical protein
MCFTEFGGAMFYFFTWIDVKNNAHLVFCLLFSFLYFSFHYALL